MNHYELLEVREDASPEVIEMAYKALIRKYHPDIYREDPKFAHDITQNINEAHNVLTNPELRAQYDRSLNEEREAEEGDEADSVLSRLPFRIPHILTVMLALCILFLGTSAFLFLQNSKLQNEQKNTLAGLETVKHTLKQAEKDNGSLQEYNDRLLEDLQFYFSNACLVTSYGRLYHHYDCPDINGRSTSILDIKNARRLGYSPCPECWENTFDDFY